MQGHQCLRCSFARFKKACNRLLEAKFKLQETSNLETIEFSARNTILLRPPMLASFWPPNEGRNLQVTSTSSDHSFGTIRACEEKLLDLHVGEEFRRAFIYYACATLLAPTSRLNGCRNLWHTIHEDGFRNDVNWAQFVLDQLVEGIRRYQQSKTSWVHGCVLFLQLHYVIKFQIPSVQVPITVPPALAWTDDLIKRRLVAEIKDRKLWSETNVDHDTNVDAENSDEIWHQYHDASAQSTNIKRLGTHRHSGVNSDAGVPINVVSDGEEQPEGNVVPTNRNVRRRRVRRMAPNLLSPYISQPQTKQSAIKIDLKQGAALVFGDDLDASEELVSMHDTILTRGNLGCFQGNGWIGNDVSSMLIRLLQYQHEPKSKLFLSPYIAEMVIHSQAKHLVREAVIGRFEPHLYQIDIPYVNVNEVFLPVLIKNHWTLYVYDLENRRIQLLDSRPVERRQCCPVVGCPQKRVQCRCIYGDPRNRSRWTCGSESMKCSTGRYFPSAIGQPVEPFFSRSRTPYWMREGAFWHPRPELDRSISFGRPVPGGLDKLLDERGLILAPSSGVRPVEPFFSRSCTRYWMRESAFWHPRPELDRSISFGRPVAFEMFEMTKEFREVLLGIAPTTSIFSYSRNFSYDLKDVNDWDREMDICVSVILRPLPTYREGVAMVPQVNLKSMKKTRSKAQAKLLIG
ncbi:hypothetical protein AAG906_019082 [Vitis piasezkii]